MEDEPRLKITLPSVASEDVVAKALQDAAL